MDEKKKDRYRNSVLCPRTVTVLAHKDKSEFLEHCVTATQEGCSGRLKTICFAFYNVVCTQICSEYLEGHDRPNQKKVYRRESNIPTRIESQIQTVSRKNVSNQLITRWRTECLQHRSRCWNHAHISYVIASIEIASDTEARVWTGTFF